MYSIALPRGVTGCDYSGDPFLHELGTTLFSFLDHWKINYVVVPLPGVDRFAILVQKRLNDFLSHVHVCVHTLRRQVPLHLADQSP
jgi:hypothetical protein